MGNEHREFRLRLWAWRISHPNRRHDRVALGVRSPLPIGGWMYITLDYGTFLSHWSPAAFVQTVCLEGFRLAFPTLRIPQPKELFQITERGVSVWEWTP